MRFITSMYPTLIVYYAWTECSFGVFMQYFLGFLFLLIFYFILFILFVGFLYCMYHNQ